MVAPAARIRHRGQHAGGLVEGQVGEILPGRDAFPVHPDDLMLGIDPGAEPAHGLAVDLDPARPDQLLTVPAAAHSRRGQHLLQPHAARDVDEAVALLAEIAAKVVVIIVGVDRQRDRGPGQALAGGGSPATGAPATRGTRGTPAPGAPRPPAEALPPGRPGV